MESIQTAAFLSCRGYSLSDEEKRLFNQTRPAGITLFARNIESREQVKHLIAEIKNTSGDDTLIAVDQEGGRVRRLKEPLTRAYAAQKQIGSLPPKEAKEAAKLHAGLIGRDLRDLGITVNFAPVLDVEHANTTDALKGRCFSATPATVATLGKLSIEEYKKTGVIPCIKHLPGHGLTQCDPHLGLPVIEAPRAELEPEFLPFRRCRNAPMGMTAHIVLTAIDPECPLTLSAKGIEQIIRQDIGFTGFLISDAIDMHALKGSALQKAQAALKAGCDCVCYCMADIEEMREMAMSCPKLSDAARERLDKAKQILHNEAETVVDDAERYAKLISDTAVYCEKYDATEVLHQLQRIKKC